MATKPEVTGIDTTVFKCDVEVGFAITGKEFAKDVTVKLEETRYKLDHEWIPATLQCESNASSASAADGTEVTVRSKPRKKDGSKCPPPGHGRGDLTVTVTNNDDHGRSTGSNTKPFDVDYHK